MEHTGRTVNYIYDDIYRLKQETIAGSAVNGGATYGYDAVGNRLNRSSTVAPVANQASTFDANDRLESDTYDANGNTKVSNGKSYDYDFEDQLTSTSDGVTFVYDGDDNRVAKTVNGVTTRYLVDTNNPTGYAQVVEEMTAGQVTRAYTFGHNMISQRQLISSQWVVSFYQYDGQNNVRLLTNPDGTVTDTYTYEGFGNLIASTGDTPNEHLFSGEQYDGNLGFYNLRARYLNPLSGRFLTSDPAKGSNSDPRSLHKYAYCVNDPIDRADPSGLFSLEEASIVVAVGGILASMAGMGYITHKVLTNLPPNSFSTAPDAVLIGYEGQLNASFVAGKVFGPAGAVATALLSGLGGVDVLIPFSSPKLWIYGYAGLGLGFEVDNVTGPGSISLHVGLIWNAKDSSSYSGPFFCSSLTTSSVNVGRWGFPAGNASLCSSKDETGVPQAYGFQVKVVETGSNSPGVSTSYSRFSPATEVTPDNVISVAPSYESIVNLGRQLITHF